MIFNSDKEISDYLNGKFFRCVSPFLSWLKIGETYWFEHCTNGEYEVRSDNNLGQRFNMSELQLLTCFFPTELENNFAGGIAYGYFLSNNHIHHTHLDALMEYYENKK
jgi:hypothetical protein